MRINQILQLQIVKFQEDIRNICIFKERNVDNINKISEVGFQISFSTKHKYFEKIICVVLFQSLKTICFFIAYVIIYSFIYSYCFIFTGGKIFHQSWGKNKKLPKSEADPPETTFESMQGKGGGKIGARVFDFTRRLHE